LGACVHSLEVIGSLTCGTCQLEGPEKTLGDLGSNGQTLLTFVKTQKLLNVRVKDDEVVQASCEVACMSGKIRAAVEEHGPAEEIHLGEIKRSVFSKVMQYCVHHQSFPAMEIQKPLRSTDLHECGVSQWDCDFIAMEQEVLFEIILAANQLEIQGLLDLCLFALIHAYMQVRSGVTPTRDWELPALRAFWTHKCTKLAQHRGGVAPYVRSPAQIGGWPVGATNCPICSPQVLRAEAWLVCEGPGQSGQHLECIREHCRLESSRARFYSKLVRGALAWRWLGPA